MRRTLRDIEDRQEVQTDLIEERDFFWKDPRTIYGLLLTCLFSGIFAAGAWSVSNTAYKNGRRSVYEASCQSSCERRLSTTQMLRETRGVFTCFCEDGAVMVPIPSRLFDDLRSR
jgi:hypothetical protein